MLSTRYRPSSTTSALKWSRDADLAGVAREHAVEVVRARHAVALHAVVVRTAQAREEPEPRHADVLPRCGGGGARRRRGARVVGRADAARVPRERGAEEALGVHRIAVAAVEPADRARAPAAQHRAALHRRAQRRDEARAPPAIDRVERVAARDEHRVRARERREIVARRARARDVDRGHARAARGERARLRLARRAQVVRGRAEVRDERALAPVAQREDRVDDLVLAEQGGARAAEHSAHRRERRRRNADGGSGEAAHA